jgi:hypothetical protein
LDVKPLPLEIDKTPGEAQAKTNVPASAWLCPLQPSLLTAGQSSSLTPDKCHLINISLEFWTSVEKIDLDHSSEWAALPVSFFVYFGGKLGFSQDPHSCPWLLSTGITKMVGVLSSLSAFLPSFTHHSLATCHENRGEAPVCLSPQWRMDCTSVSVIPTEYLHLHSTESMVRVGRYNTQIRFWSARTDTS